MNPFYLNIKQLVIEDLVTKPKDELREMRTSMLEHSHIDAAAFLIECIDEVLDENSH